MRGHAAGEKWNEQCGGTNKARVDAVKSPQLLSHNKEGYLFMAIILCMICLRRLVSFFYHLTSFGLLYLSLLGSIVHWCPSQIVSICYRATVIHNPLQAVCLLHGIRAECCVIP